MTADTKRYSLTIGVNEATDFVDDGRYATWSERGGVSWCDCNGVNKYIFATRREAIEAGIAQLEEMLAVEEDARADKDM